MTTGREGIRGPVDAVLFDLDGTLVDTAPDMVAALVRLQRERGDAAVDYDLARSNVSNGAAGLLRIAFPDVDEDARAELHRQFLDFYRQNVSRESQVFPGLEPLLAEIERRRRPWGVVTNKPSFLTDALLDALALSRRMACAISGDTLPERKPHPAPMLLASRLMNVTPERTVYVGDAARDIEAGRAAGMQTIAAGWGYITTGDDPAAWNADHVLASPDELAQLLTKALG